MECISWGDWTVKLQNNPPKTGRGRGEMSRKRYWFEKYAMNGKGPFSHINTELMIEASSKVRINDWGEFEVIETLEPNQIPFDSIEVEID